MDRFTDLPAGAIEVNTLDSSVLYVRAAEIGSTPAVEVVVADGQPPARSYLSSDQAELLQVALARAVREARDA